MSSNILELDLFENETLKKQKKKYNSFFRFNFMYKILRIIIHIDERVKG